MGSLRITGGIFKGRSIRLPDRNARYTSSKVRQAIFDLVGDVSGLAILDLFAGAGSFSIEAMSRGAASAVCVEKDRQMAEALRSNLKRLQLDKDCLVVNMDVRYAVPSLLKQHRRSYDLVFMDPPYDVGLVRETIQLLRRCPLCAPDGLVVIEHSKREELPVELLDGRHQVRGRSYGDTVVSIIDCTGRAKERSGV